MSDKREKLVALAAELASEFATRAATLWDQLPRSGSE